MWELFRLYPTVDISFDHGSTRFGELVGKPENLRMVDKNGTTLTENAPNPHEIRGDTLVVLNKESDNYHKLMNCANDAPGLIKFSHEVPAGRFRIRKRRGGLPLVEQVQQVRRIALITGDGGVNNSLFENKGEPMELEEIREASDVKKGFPLVYDAIINEATEGILESCGCKAEGGALEKVVSLETKLAEKDASITELQEKLDVFEGEKKLVDRKKAILELAKELKRTCSDEILESLLEYPDTEAGKGHIERLLETQPELKEDGEDPDPKPKPTQEGSVSTPAPRKLRQTADRLAQEYANANN